MNRMFIMASILTVAMIAMGCTREKPPPAPSPGQALQPVMVRNTPTPLIISGAATSPTATPTFPTVSTPAPGLPTLTRVVGLNAPISTIAVPTATTAPTRSSGPTTYTVQWGDWLSKIARQFGVSNEAIIAANPRMNPNLLIPGQVLNIPAPGGVPSPPGATPPPGGSGPTTYTVQRGEWFYAIARRYGVSVEALQGANPGVSPNIVYPGQVLNIPGTSSPAPAPPATTTPPTSDTSRPTRYTVQPGDTIFSIALRFNTTAYAIQFANRLPNPHFIFPGQVLLIPK